MASTVVTKGVFANKVDKRRGLFNSHGVEIAKPQKAAVDFMIIFSKICRVRLIPCTEEHKLTFFYQ
ncbi:hypothetical protein ACLOJK_031307 [Asimina triloba]